MQEDNRKAGQEERKIQENRINSSEKIKVKDIAQDTDEAVHEHIHEEDVTQKVMNNEKITKITEINEIEKRKTALKTLNPYVNSNSQSNIPKQDCPEVSLTNYYYFDAKLDLYIPRNISIEEQHSQVIKLFSSSFLQF